jgi:uncharacterized repeat protein (TIGR03833 family)
VDGLQRNQVHIGSRVQVELKQDQRSGRLTAGVVARILTRSAYHPHGIKVKLEDGQVGRVKRIDAAAESTGDGPG